MTARTTTLLMFSAMPQVRRPGCSCKPKRRTTQLPGMRWRSRRNQREASSGYQKSPEALAAEGRAWMAFILWVCFGRLGSYMAKRILRNRTPRLPSPPSGRCLMEFHSLQRRCCNLRDSGSTALSSPSSSGPRPSVPSPTALRLWRLCGAFSWSLLSACPSSWQASVGSGVARSRT
jgi:hypothetical protein